MENFLEGYTEDEIEEMKLQFYQDEIKFQVQQEELKRAEYNKTGGL